MTGKNLNVLVGAGGTGGHLFPALAVLEQMREMTGGRLQAYFVGREDKIEARAVPQAGFNFIPMDVSGLTSILSLSTLTMPIKMYKAVSKCRSIIKEKNIDLALCTGAYISYPPGSAAHLEKIPLVLMESNVNPGKSIKLLAPKANMIISSFDGSEKYFSPSIRPKLRLLGNPVRHSIVAMPGRKEGLSRFGLDPGRHTILVFGGSLGAKSINGTIESLLEEIGRADYQMIWQTGKSYRPSRALPANVKQLEFIDDMAAAYASADLVVSRSGATTVAELCICGKPSILIPLATASNKEQERNAEILEEKDAAIMIHDDAVGKSLFHVMNEIVTNSRRLEEMGSNAAAMGRPNAARDAAREILSLVNYL